MYRDELTFAGFVAMAAVSALAIVILRPDGDPAPPAGKWKIIDRNDRGPQHWWVLAADDDARAWAGAHPREVISSCVDAHARDLTPVNRVRL
jgi:hypothetical protein